MIRPRRSGVRVERFTELEGAVLGLVWRDGPQTPYAIRSQFLRSRSSHFSGSAGAIYPVVRRLTAAKLLRATDAARGRRGGRRYLLTAAGKAALRAWMTETEAWMASVEFDPIRSRVHFLGALSVRRRRRFVVETLVSLESEIRATRDLLAALDDDEDRWRAWGARGALGVLRARRAWLRKLQREIE